MEIEVLISAMYQTDFTLPKKMNIQGKGIVVNQTDLVEFPNLNEVNSEVKFYSTSERGLSKSRNVALKKASADLCVITDEDVHYIDGFREIILNAYKKYSDADVILFDFYKDNKKRSKKIKQNGGKLSLLQSLRGNSVRITFKRKAVINNDISFNENFGSGSGQFIASEDLVFITDCNRKKLKIYYEPVPILNLIEKESTWFKGFNKEYFETIGAFSYHLLGGFWFVYALQFLLRHRNIYKLQEFFNKLNLIRSGANKYKAIK